VTLSLRRPSIPLADAGVLRRPVRRTLAVRLGLAVVLAGLLAACFVLARDLRARPSTYFATGGGVVVADLSTSVEPSKYRRLSRVLTTLTETSQPMGLVVFSDVAYQMLPLGTKGEELRPMLRFFRPPPTDTGRGRRSRGFGFLESPWSGSFRGGTRISHGLREARLALERAGVTGGSVLLVSDLDDSPFDLPALTRELVRFNREGIDLRVVPLFPGPDDRAFFERLAGRDAFVANDELLANTALEEHRTLAAAFPVALLAAVAVLLLLLAVNEHVGGRLAWRRR
jgi:hypothetical protein